MLQQGKGYQNASQTESQSEKYVGNIITFYFGPHHTGPFKFLGEKMWSDIVSSQINTVLNWSVQ